MTAMVLFAALGVVSLLVLIAEPIGRFARLLGQRVWESLVISPAHTGEPDCPCDSCLPENAPIVTPEMRYEIDEYIRNCVTRAIADMQPSDEDEWGVPAVERIPDPDETDYSVDEMFMELTLPLIQDGEFCESFEDAQTWERMRRAIDGDE